MENPCGFLRGRQIGGAQEVKMGGLPREHGGVPRGAGDPELTEWGGDDMCGDFKGNVCPVVSRPDKQRLWAPGPQRVLGAGVGRPGREDGSGRVPAFQTAECRQVCEARVTLLRRLGPRSTDPLD